MHESTEEKFVLKVVKLENVSHKVVTSLQSHLNKTCRIMHENIILNISTRVTASECKVLMPHLGNL
jgi:hypothetical protein